MGQDELPRSTIFPGSSPWKCTFLKFVFIQIYLFIKIKIYLGTVEIVPSFQVYMIVIQFLYALCYARKCSYHGTRHYYNITDYVPYLVPFILLTCSITGTLCFPLSSPVLPISYPLPSGNQ